MLIDSLPLVLSILGGLVYRSRLWTPLTKIRSAYDLIKFLLQTTLTSTQLVTIIYMLADTYCSMVSTALECIDYVAEIEKLPMATFENTGDQLESNKKGSYIRDLPTSAETFVATAPDATLYHKEDLKIETLGGTVKQQQTVRGDILVNWVPDCDSKMKPIQQKYVPLHQHTKTWDDVKNLDITQNRELAKELIHIHKEDQVNAELIYKSLEDYGRAVQDSDYHF